MKRLISFFVFLLAFAATFIVSVMLPSPLLAQQPVTDDQVNEIARDLYCPICENTPLDACPTQACQDWRDEIRTRLSEGRSRAEIEQYFVDRHGARVLAQPEFSGFTILVWLLPILVVVVGGFLFYRYLTSIRQVPATASGPSRRDETATVAQGSAQKPPPAPDVNDYISRVEKEVREE